MELIQEFCLHGARTQLLEEIVLVIRNQDSRRFFIDLDNRSPLLVGDPPDELVKSMGASWLELYPTNSLVRV
jgi:hypothetical protein